MSETVYAPWKSNYERVQDGASKKGLWLRYRSDPTECVDYPKVEVLESFDYSKYFTITSAL